MFNLIGKLFDFLANISRRKFEVNEANKKFKREKLPICYESLDRVITLFPNQSPNDILSRLENPPQYSLENFDVILKILDYSIEDYIKIIDDPLIGFTRKSEIELKIIYTENVKNKISSIKNDYFNALEEYNKFKENYKLYIDLYSSLEVKYYFSCFDRIINYVFIIGNSSFSCNEQDLNIIDNARNNIVCSIKRDLYI